MAHHAITERGQVAAAGDGRGRIDYDIAAGTAQKAMSYYDLTLSPDEEKTYQYAIQNSDEKGPCCCQCWRWRVYGGLGKFLIREHRFTGEQLVKVWNLSDGCGGVEEHHG